mmetsp:Transcript_6699/g.10763  ORF Transcript_6699/g.10763 Transcript_6699/m.10763 type:complete len:257 (-) Transcript_6699:125-895(-)
MMVLRVLRSPPLLFFTIIVQIDLEQLFLDLRHLGQSLLFSPHRLEAVAFPPKEFVKAAVVLDLLVFFNALEVAFSLSLSLMLFILEKRVNILVFILVILIGSGAGGEFWRFHLINMALFNKRLQLAFKSFNVPRTSSHERPFILLNSIFKPVAELLLILENLRVEDSAFVGHLPDVVVTEAVSLIVEEGHGFLVSLGQNSTAFQLEVVDELDAGEHALEVGKFYDPGLFGLAISSLEPLPILDLTTDIQHLSNEII